MEQNCEAAGVMQCTCSKSKRFDKNIPIFTSNILLAIYNVYILPNTSAINDKYNLLSFSVLSIVMINSRLIRNTFDVRIEGYIYILCEKNELLLQYSSIC